MLWMVGTVVGLGVEVAGIVVLGRLACRRFEAISPGGDGAETVGPWAPDGCAAPVGDSTGLDQLALLVRATVDGAVPRDRGDRLRADRHRSTVGWRGSRPIRLSRHPEVPVPLSRTVDPAREGRRETVIDGTVRPGPTRRRTS